MHKNCSSLTIHPVLPPAPLFQQGGVVGGIRMFKFIRAGNNGQWEVATSNARPRFYDTNEDSNISKHDWNMEVGMRNTFREVEALEPVGQDLQGLLCCHFMPCTYPCSRASTAYRYLRGGKAAHALRQVAFLAVRQLHAGFGNGRAAHLMHLTGKSA